MPPLGFLAQDRNPVPSAEPGTGTLARSAPAPLVHGALGLGATGSHWEPPDPLLMRWESSSSPHRDADLGAAVTPKTSPAAFF